MLTEHLNGLDPEWTRVSKVFDALGHEQRQRIILLFEPGESLNATRIVETLGLSRTAAMHHIQTLEAAGVLMKSREGRETLYRPDFRLIENALEKALAAVRELHPSDSNS